MMAGLDTYSYYFGLATAIVLGYFLSSLRIERLVITFIVMLQERVSGEYLEKKTIEDGNTIASTKETFSIPSVLSGWTEEKLFELERRAIFSKACDLMAQESKLLTGAPRHGCLSLMRLDFRNQATIVLTTLPASPSLSSLGRISSCVRSTMYVGIVHML